MRVRFRTGAPVGRVAAALALAGLLGCATVLPPQTASTVEPGGYQVGGSLAYAQWCGVSVDPLGDCNLSPQGVPLPQVRLGARHGLGPGMDLGASAHVAGALGRGVEGGLYLDLKKELWSRSLGEGRRQVVSLAPGLGYTAIALTELYGSARVAVADLGLPLYFGHQTDTVEWVLSARFVERLAFQNRDDVPGRDLSASGELGVGLGLVRRRSPHWGLELAYQARVDAPAGGLFLVSVGLSFDVGVGEELEEP